MLRLKCDLFDADRARRRRHARHGRSRMGPPRARSASCWPRQVIRTSRARATRSRASRGQPADDCHVFHAGTRLEGGTVRHQRRARAVRDGAGRQREDGAAARLRGRSSRSDFDGHAVPPRHRAPRVARGRLGSARRRSSPTWTPRLSTPTLPDCRTRIVAALEALDGRASAATRGRAPKAAAG